MKPRFFATPADFRRWLEENHESARELSVGIRKKGSSRPGLGYVDAVDEALCFGWIDGVTHSLDEDRYTIRFSPRRPGSNWSLINVRKVEKLIAAGRMRPAGLRAFEERSAARTGVYSFEQRAEARLDPPMEERFRKHAAAWKYWAACPPGYRKTVTFWVMSAKKPETRDKRLATLIDDCAHARRIAALARPEKNPGPRGPRRAPRGARLT
jgi:uncharacterized protein YdeI (YjbR/CyaY-like superfamily)